MIEFQYSKDPFTMMQGSFETEKSHLFSSRMEVSFLQGDLLATLETLPLVAVLQGAIYHLDTVHGVFIVSVQKRVLLLCEPILAH